MYQDTAERTIAQQNKKQLARTDKMSEWISVKDRLPYAIQPVLAIWVECDQVAQVLVAQIEPDTIWWAVGPFDSRRLDKGDVTHWMPLPEPPSE